MAFDLAGAYENQLLAQHIDSLCFRSLPSPVYVTIMNKADPEFFDLLVSSYRRFFGAPPVFLEGSNHSARWLYEDASYCVLAHNTDAAPRFIYANKAAQACFEFGWDEFISLPSHLSAEASDRAERQKLLDAVARNGFATGYVGLRIAKSGRRFWIEDGILWQLVDRSGTLRGQAATFARWRDV